MLIVGSIDGGGPEHPRGGHGEVELPGGGTDLDLDTDILATARRETIEESGIYILSGSTDITVTALSRSRERAAYTGLVVVRYNNLIPFDPDFRTQETSSVSLVEPMDLIGMPTFEEDPDAQRKTYRAHRIMAAHALIIVQEGVESSNPEMLFPPFNDQRMMGHLSGHYDDCLS